MTELLPPAGQKVLRPDGGMDQTWYEKLRSAFGSINTATGNIGGLGTAAKKNIGTDGDSVPLLNTANTFSAAQTFDAVELEFAASVAWDWSLGPIAKVTLTGDAALAAPTNTNGKAGTWSLFVYQNAIGGHTLTLDGIYLPPGGLAFELNEDANALNLLTFITDGTKIAYSASKDHKPV